MGAAISTNPIVECQSKSQWEPQFEASKLSNKLLVIDFTATCSSRLMWIGWRTWLGHLGLKRRPAYVFQKIGKEIDRVVGVKKDELERKIEKHRV
ncbi:hypothetical protein SLE2022_202240 [Rubroshorea leprosula]